MKIEAKRRGYKINFPKVCLRSTLQVELHSLGCKNFEIFRINHKVALLDFVTWCKCLRHALELLLAFTAKFIDLEAVQSHRLEN